MLVGWHKIGHIAHDEDLARACTQQHPRIGARVAAGDNQRARCLPLAQALKDTLLATKVLLLKAFEARNKIRNIRQVHPSSNSTCKGPESLSLNSIS